MMVGLVALVSIGCRTASNTTSASRATRAISPAFYPIGLYSVGTTNDFALLRDAGFNTVVGRADRAYLDAAEAAGLKVLATPGSMAGTRFDEAAARRFVREFDQHPALWAWYLVDEPELSAVSPEAVSSAHQLVKAQGGSKPTALNLYQGQEALHYAGRTDILMINRYPVPWLPLANFGQHLTMARLGLGKDRPLIAIVQAFDWSYARRELPREENLRPPTAAEMRCLAYDALARGADGLLFFAYDSGGWRIREHPETWAALTNLVREVNERRSLFTAKQLWWPRKHWFPEADRRFNAALQSSVSSALLRVSTGSGRVPAGNYVLAVNNTEQPLTYQFVLPGSGSDAPDAGRQTTPVSVAVFEENRVLETREGWLADRFEPYAIHLYGPLGAAE